jgi:hypothetical protein
MNQEHRKAGKVERVVPNALLRARAIGLGQADPPSYFPD